VREKIFVPLQLGPSSGENHFSMALRERNGQREERRGRRCQTSAHSPLVRNASFFLLDVPVSPVLRYTPIESDRGETHYCDSSRDAIDRYARKRRKTQRNGKEEISNFNTTLLLLSPSPAGKIDKKKKKRKKRRRKEEKKEGGEKRFCRSFILVFSPFGGVVKSRYRRERSHRNIEDGSNRRWGR